jgi:uncharacterized protein (DUF58 family)
MALTPQPAGPGRVVSSPRLYAYLAVGSAGLLVGLATGRPGIAAFGAPFLVLATVSVTLAPRSRLQLAVDWQPERALSGDPLLLRVRGAVAPVPGRFELLARHRGPVDVTAPARSLSLLLTSTGAIAADLAADTEGWGVARVERGYARVTGPLGLVHQSWSLPLDAVARVLPPPETLRELLDPMARAAAGSHPSRARGTGIDFAELRPAVPGDRLADVNWLASGRRAAAAPGSPPRQLVVTVRHPERTGDAVLLLDTLADDRVAEAPWLRAAAAAAWSIARAHLAVQDRVGLVALGGYPRWVRPSVGRAARYAVLDALLTVQASWSAVDRTLTGTPVHLLPPGALIVAISPLHDPRFVAAVIDLRRQDRDVVVVAVDASAWLPALTGTAALAGRLWALTLDDRVARLEQAGVPVARWRTGPTDPSDDIGVAQAIALLRRRRRAPVRVRGS